jgi:hypothetical protein
MSDASPAEADGAHIVHLTPAFRIQRTNKKIVIPDLIRDPLNIANAQAHAISEWTPAQGRGDDLSCD